MRSPITQILLSYVWYECIRYIYFENNLLLIVSPTFAICFLKFNLLSIFTPRSLNSSTYLIWTFLIYKLSRGLNLLFVIIIAIVFAQLMSIRLLLHQSRSGKALESNSFIKFQVLILISKLLCRQRHS